MAVRIRILRPYLLLGSMHLSQQSSPMPQLRSKNEGDQSEKEMLTEGSPADPTLVDAVSSKDGARGVTTAVRTSTSRTSAKNLKR